MTATTLRHSFGDRLIDSSRFRQTMKALYRFRGGRALAHLARARLYRSRQVVIEDFDGDLRFSCCLNEHMGSQIYWRGAYSWAQLHALHGLLRDDMVFIDAGANQGEFSVFAAKRLPGGRVISFEPVAELRERLATNVALNGFDNVVIRSEALWSEPTTMALHRHTDQYRDGSVNEGLGSLFEAETATAAVEEVTCARLDDVTEELGLTRVDVIKIDVEGAESHVLVGAATTIRRHRPVLILEADQEQAITAGVAVDDLLDQLEAEGYRLEVIERNGSTRSLDRQRLRSHEDLLCLPR